MGDLENIKAGLLDEIAYHFEEIDKLSNGSEDQKVMVQDTKALIDAFNSLIQTENDQLEKEKRRKLDEEKNQAMYELEIQKSKLGWQRVTFEMAKLLIPAVITLKSYDYFQKRILKFEETGRITSDAGRQLRLPSLPRLWNK